MDNMFIIVEGMESVDPDIQGPERLVLSMKHVGGSITMTTTTDLVAFAVSTVTDFPAVRLFCIYAALSIFFAYFMLVTLFLAILTWDIHRVEAGKRDVCPCIKVEGHNNDNPWLKEEDNISKKVRNIQRGKLSETLYLKQLILVAENVNICMLSYKIHIYPTRVLISCFSFGFKTICADLET